MSAWYYSQAGQAVGPFQLEVLGQLVRAGVINDGTLVRNGDEEWQPLATVLTDAPTTSPATTAQDEAHYYYLDANDQPVGPFDLAALHHLHAEKAFSADTLVSAVGDPGWVLAARLLKLPGSIPPASAPVASPVGTDVHPRHLPFERYVLLTAATFGFYPFYLIPCQSRDLKAITGRERMEFTALLILGVVTLGLLLLVMEVLYAFDLERHGKAIGKAGRRESLGLLVLVLNVFSLVLGYAIDSFVLSWLVGCLLGGSALWLLQREINLYAGAPQPGPN